MPRPILSRTTELHQLAQVARLVRVWLWLVMVAVGVVAAINFFMGWKNEGIALLAAGAIAGIGLTVGRRGHSKVSSALLCLSIYVAVMLAAFHGIGVFDEALLVFPALILIATFVLPGSYGTVTATVVSVVSVFALQGMQVLGWTNPPYGVTWLRPVFASVVFIATGGVAWIVHDVWEEDLFNLVESYEATLRGWAALLEAKGGDVGGHSQRVTDLSEALGKKLGCSETELEALRRGAYLHDIGKMAIPDGILMKPGPLDDEELWLVRRHPDVAQEILADIEFLRPAAPVPHSHHERWDGMGYPQGLKGTQIPRIARIFTVADQWDALNSHRPYRRAWPRDEVIEYVVENSGRIYDPDVVEALLALIQEDAEVLGRQGATRPDTGP